MSTKKRCTNPRRAKVHFCRGCGCHYIDVGGGHACKDAGAMRNKDVRALIDAGLEQVQIIVDYKERVHNAEKEVLRLKVKLRAITCGDCGKNMLECRCDDN